MLCKVILGPAFPYSGYVDMFCNVYSVSQKNPAVFWYFSKTVGNF